MKRPENNDWLDKALTKAIGSEESKPNFEKWKQDHHEAVEMLTSRMDRVSSVTTSPHNIRDIIMKSRIVKLAAAAAIIIAVMMSIHFWEKSTPSAYAFEQTIEAMQNKRSFHIQTYWGLLPKDEFWAEFDENGQVVRYRQEEKEEDRQDYEGPIVTLWEDNIRFKYYPKPDNICLITNTSNTEPELEEFDPETAVRSAYEQVAEGKATIEIEEPSTDEGRITITVTRTDRFARQVLLIDSDTKFVIRTDTYYWDNEEGQEFSKGIEVLEYNQPIDANMFSPDFPEDTITIDQVSQEVGMAQGDMSDGEAASEIVREALKSWVAGDYIKVGKLFGGAPPELFTERYVNLQPVSIISIGRPVPVQYIKPLFKVKCEYDAEHDGEIKTIKLTFDVLAVDGQPRRWYVSYQLKL